MWTKITLQITNFANNQSEVHKTCEKDYKNIRHDTELIESFAIAIVDVLIDCKFLLTHSSLPWITLYSIASPFIPKE